MSRLTVLRREALRDLLQQGHSSTQAELVERLAERGYAATQSTVSRDLKRLGARRSTGDDGVAVYRLQGRRRLSPGMVIRVDHNEHMVVLRTEIGRAQAVGLDLDAIEHPEILGTLAGDDTVLVVPRSVTRTARLATQIRSMVGLK